MIILLIVLLSLCAIYFTRLLKKKSMKLAANAVATLYGVLIAWIYFVFVIDVACFGFKDTESRFSIILGSDIYHSFVDITAKMFNIPSGMLVAISIVSTLIFVFGLMVAFHGFFEIAKEIRYIAKKSKIVSYKKENKPALSNKPVIIKTSIYRINCRMNC